MKAFSISNIDAPTRVNTPISINTQREAKGTLGALR